MTTSTPIDPALQALTRQLGGALVAALPVPDDPGPPLLLPRAAQPIAPSLLARSMPGTQARQEAQALYSRCLAHFRRSALAGAPHDDAGLAAAYFVLANLDVLHDLHPDAEALARVERQLRHTLHQLRAWQRASLRERQSACEQLAVIGVLVAESATAARAQGLVAQAHVQQAARAYLVRWLGINPDGLRLGPQGLALELVAA
jgi:hypothetical protein